MASALAAPELSVRVGGLRALGTNAGRGPHGDFTDRPGVRIRRRPPQSDVG